MLGKRSHRRPIWAFSEGGESVSADRGVTAGRSQGSFTTVRLAATLGDRSPKDERHDPEDEKTPAHQGAPFHLRVGENKAPGEP